MLLNLSVAFENEIVNELTSSDSTATYAIVGVSNGVVIVGILVTYLTWPLKELLLLYCLDLVQTSHSVLGDLALLST